MGGALGDGEFQPHTVTFTAPLSGWYRLRVAATLPEGGEFGAIYPAPYVVQLAEGPDWVYDQPEILEWAGGPCAGECRW